VSSDWAYAQPELKGGKARSFPSWLWAVLAGVLVLLAVFIIIFLVRSFRGAKEEPAPTPTVVEMPTETPQPTVSETATAGPPVARPRSSSNDQMALLASANPVQVGDVLTLQVTLTNTWEVPCTDVHIFLDKPDVSVLELSSPSVVVSQDEIVPGASHTVTYTLNAVGEGVAALEASVTVVLDAESSELRAEGLRSPALEISVVTAP